MPPPVPAPDPEADEFATKVNEAVGDGVDWFLDAGWQLMQAKVALEHGRIRIGLRTAEMLMRVAEHRALSDSQHLAKLPPSLTILDVLAEGTVEVIEAGIHAGEIGPATTANEARKFIRSHSPRSAHRTRAIKLNAANRLKRGDAVLWKELDKWPDEALGQFVENLASFAEEAVASCPSMMSVMHSLTISSSVISSPMPASRAAINMASKSSAGGDGLFRRELICA
mgnify:CR=1 FL=1